MIWNRPAIFATLFPSAAHSQQRAATRRWRDAVSDDPQLAQDLIRLGGVLALQPPGPTEATLAYEAGRRDFALQLLAMSGLTPYQLSNLMMETDHD